MTKDPFKYFRIEARELVDGLAQGALELEKGQGRGEAVVRLLRLAHTLKGASRVVKLGPIAELAHALEDVLAPFRDAGTVISKEAVLQVLRLLDGIRAKVHELDAPAPAATPALQTVAAPVVPASVTTTPDVFETVRIDLSEMESFLGAVSEIGTQGGSLRTGLRRLQRGGVVARDLHRSLSHPEKAGDSAVKATTLVEDLQQELLGAQRLLTADIERLQSRLERIHESAHRMKLLPASTIFPTLESAVLDAGRSVERLVGFHSSGGDHRLDAQMLGSLRDALLHVVRNAVAHGIEAAADRARAGKPPEGTVRLSVEQRGRRISFLCSDDGRGIDIDAVRRTALERGLLSPAESARIGLDEAVALLLKGGVSTTSRVTELSGRGIGLDVLRETVTRLKGEISVASTPGRGTTIEIVVPVSLASQAVLLVESRDIPVSIPLESVVKCLLLKPADVSRSANKETIRHEERTIPLVDLAAALRRPDVSGRVTNWPAVIIRGGGEEVALRVDLLVGAGRALVRPLPPAVQADPLIYGASLDRDGNPRLALDPAGLIEAARKGSSLPFQPAARDRLPILVIDDSLTTRMLEQSILESAGYEVDLASSGNEGLSKARERRYSLFICDVEMPGMNGFEFVTRTRADAALKDIPSILVTSLASPEDKSRGKRAGARAYIVKSEFDQSAFMQIIRGLIE